MNIFCVVKKATHRFIVLSFFPLILSAQQQPFNFEETSKKALHHVLSNPDSAKYYFDLMIKNIPNSNIHDTAAAKIYNNYGLYYSQISRLDSAKIYLEKAVEKSKANPKNRAGSILNLANVLRNEFNYESSLKYLDTALKIYDSLNDKTGVAVTYGEIGSNYAYMLENYKAVDCFLKSIKILEELSDNRRMGIVKQKLANIYFKTKNFDFALELYEEALASMKEARDMRNYYLTLINYGDCLIQLKQYKKAKSAYLEAAEGVKTFHSDELIGLAYRGLGRIYFYKQDFDTSLKYTEMAFDYVHHSRSFRLLRVGAEYVELLNKMKKYDQALKVIESVNSFPDQTLFNIEDQMIFHLAGAITYKNLQFKDKAISYLEEVITLKDSISKADKEVEIIEIQKKFQTELQHEKNRALEIKNNLLNEKIQARNKIYVLGAIVIAVLIAMIIIITRNFKLKGKYQKLKLKRAENAKKWALMKREEENKLLEVQKQTLTLREQELTSMTLLLADIQEQIASIIESDKNNDSVINIKKALRNLIKQKNYWEEFTIKFSQIHPDFINNLKNRFPGLTKNDIDFISLLKLNLSNKEIATLLKISHESVISKKYRIKKKLQIEDDAEFNKILSEL